MGMLYGDFVNFTFQVYGLTTANYCTHK